MLNHGDFLAEYELVTGTIEEEQHAHALNSLATLCHQDNIKWWHDPTTGARVGNKGEKLMLMVSELAEAMEAERRDLMDDKLPHLKGAVVELADALIRLLDYCGAYGYDIGGAFVEKMRYNATRKDHTNAERLGPNGKKF